MWELVFNPTGFPGDAAVIWKDERPEMLYKLIGELVADSEGEWHPADFTVRKGETACSKSSGRITAKSGRC